MITGEIVAMALNATAWHRSQIQTFYYRADDGTVLHVVRDLTKTEGSDVIWSEKIPPDKFWQNDAAYQRKALAKERAEADVLAERINTLLGLT